MSTLSALLADIEQSAARVKELEGELATEKEHANALVDQYRTQSGDALKFLGIAEPKKEKKVKSQDEVLLGAANRKIRQMVKGGEKNLKAVLAGAVEVADKLAKDKFGLAELPAQIKVQIEEKVKSLAKK